MSEMRSSVIDLPDEYTAVQRWRLQTYIMRKVVNVQSARAEDFGAQGKKLTVSPPMHVQHLETVLYAFDQDERSGKLNHD
jgi:hypothetical protein